MHCERPLAYRDTLHCCYSYHTRENFTFSQLCSALAIPTLLLGADKRQTCFTSLRLSATLVLCDSSAPQVKLCCSVLQPGLWLCVGTGSLGAGPGSKRDGWGSVLAGEEGQPELLGHLHPQHSQGSSASYKAPRWALISVTSAHWLQAED